MLNQVILMGRLTRDPELRYTQSEIPVASFSLAVERDYGERTTDFIDIVAWRNTATFAAKHFKKGSAAAIVGKLQIREWKDNNGNKRRNAEVIADNIYFADSKKNGNSEDYAAPTEFDIDAPSAFSDLSDTDGELPF